MTTQTFTLTIALGNDAMRSGDDLAHALRETADTLANRYDGLTMPDTVPQSIRDLNGQTVGRWRVTERQTPAGIAAHILDGHAIRPHWNRNGDQVAALIAEAIEYDREGK